MSNVQPTVDVDASNEGPDVRKTEITVFGSNFPPGTVVNITSAGRRGSADVGADGHFSWSFEVRPRMACGASASSVVHGSDGIRVTGDGVVLCPL